MEAGGKGEVRNGRLAAVKSFLALKRLPVAAHEVPQPARRWQPVQWYAYRLTVPHWHDPDDNMLRFLLGSGAV